MRTTLILATLAMTMLLGLAPASAEDEGKCTPWLPPYTADAGIRYCITQNDPDCLVWREQIYIWGTTRDCVVAQP